MGRMSAAARTLSPPRRVATPLATFLVLGVVLSWYPWVLHLMGRPGNGGPNPLGLLLAALIAGAVANGWRGTAEILRSIVRVRAPLSVWWVVLFVPAITLALAIAIASFAGRKIVPKPVPWSDLLDTFLIMFLFVGLGEEPAWRGFLLPLLERAMTPVRATVIVSVVWALWHIPLMGTEFAWPLVPAFLVSLIGAAFIQSWLYNASSGSSLLPKTMHALLNTAGAGYVFKLIAPADLLTLWWSYAVLWLAAGIIAAVTTRGRLGRS